MAPIVSPDAAEAVTRVKGVDGFWTDTVDEHLAESFPERDKLLGRQILITKEHNRMLMQSSPDFGINTLVSVFR